MAIDDEMVQVLNSSTTGDDICQNGQNLLTRPFIGKLLRSTF
jgi:hypothetical protein